MDLKEIRHLIKLLADTDVAEIEIKEELQTVRITRHVGIVSGLPPVAVASPHRPVVTYLNTPPSASDDAATASNNQGNHDEVSGTKTVSITSPMVGTYYHAASPDTLPFVSRGDVVKKGQVVCIIEAMKLMNEIESEHAGRVVSILKENACPVEYGETLFVIEPV